MYEIEYSLAWKLETIYSANTLYSQWKCFVSTFSSDDAWLVNEMHAVTNNLHLSFIILVIDYFNNSVFAALLRNLVFGLLYTTK